MLTTGTATLDHLLTIGQCPTSSWGLGFQGSASKSVEETVFVKEESEGEDDQTGVHLVDLDQAKVHKNHSSADVIGGVFDERVTRKKQIDFKEMVKLVVSWLR
ncbi:hypothetical protein F2Q70_00014938 [Brassica cretica]|uniref:Uncharacterized protein n=1 Tax=Brassica cretica TaxID=69181 RepID=A0A8S9HW22_BRACR|nr:hypothetical protein F2Q70_00014938 [Brassica cretica]